MTDGKRAAPAAGRAGKRRYRRPRATLCPTRMEHRSATVTGHKLRKRDASSFVGHRPFSPGVPPRRVSRAPGNVPSAGGPPCVTDGNGPTRSPSRGRGGEAAGTRGAATSLGPHTPVSVLRATSRAAQAETQPRFMTREALPGRLRRDRRRRAGGGTRGPGPAGLPSPRRRPGVPPSSEAPASSSGPRDDRTGLLLLAPRHLEGRVKAPRLRPAPASCVRAAPASARQWPH